MADLSLHDAPLSEVEARLSDLVREALELRGGVSLPGPQAGPSDVIKSMSDTRRALDRVEFLLNQGVRAKARVSRLNASAVAAFDDAWDSASKGTRGNLLANRGGDYSGPRERYAEANLAAFNELRDKRQAERMLSVAVEVETVLRNCHRGLDSLRADHHALLRAFNVQSVLES